MTEPPQVVPPVNVAVPHGGEHPAGTHAAEVPVLVAVLLFVKPLLVAVTDTVADVLYPKPDCVTVPDV
jgi:hypothetical protein